MKSIPLLAAPLVALALAACSADIQPTAAAKTQAVAEQNQNSLLTATPIPTLGRSEERENLIERAERLNQQNMVGCVSIFTPNGVLLYQGVVDGKVSSLNSYLLPGEQRINGVSGGYSDNVNTIEAPDIDGAYGQNADGVFFFNADSNAYIEAGGVTYIYTDQCLKTEQKPLLVQQVAGQ